MTNNETNERIKCLEKTIVALDTSFETGNDCLNPFTGEVVLDNEYDAFKKELLTICSESKIFKSVTASKTKISNKKIVHDPPMTSISKCNGSEEEKKEILNKWFGDCRKIDTKSPSASFFCMSYKHDGLALSCEYEKGKLTKVGLRSKSGVDGIDVTAKTKYIDNLPQTLPLPITCTIRGEVETTISVFNKVSEQLGENAKANPRAHTAGSMNQKTAEKMKDRGLRFTAYNILKIDNPPYSTEIERYIWATKTLKLNFVKTVIFNASLLKIFEDNHRRLDWMVDGAVISVNDLALQKQLGHSGNKNTGNPKGKIAFKFKDEVKKAIVKSVIWQTGRTGNITPVLIFDGISLEGTTVSKCTAHNLGIIKNNNIGVGSEIEIIKSGKIIPKIHKVVKAQGSASIPRKCPSCNYDLIKVDGAGGALSLICNNNECPAQNIKNLNHWMTILGVKGIAEKNIERLVDIGLIQKPGDFYRLTIPNLISAGITERTAVLTVSRIWMINSPENIKDNTLLIDSIKDHQNTGKIKVSMGKFFAAFGMQAAGQSTGEILEKEIGDWQKIKISTVSELEVFDGIGPIMAQEIVSFFQKNKAMVEDVEQYFRFKTKILGGKLEGKKFCLSGSLDEGKQKWKKAIESQGGEIKSSVSKTLDYLVAGDGSGAKTDRANDLGIKILTTDGLIDLLKN